MASGAALLRETTPRRNIVLLHRDSPGTNGSTSPTATPTATTPTAASAPPAKTPSGRHARCPSTGAVIYPPQLPSALSPNSHGGHVRSASNIPAKSRTLPYPPRSPLPTSPATTSSTTTTGTVSVSGSSHARAFSVMLPAKPTVNSGESLALLNSLRTHPGGCPG